MFDGVNPNLERALNLAKEEAFFWSLAGAGGISFLGSHSVDLEEFNLWCDVFSFLLSSLSLEWMSGGLRLWLL